MAHFVVIHGGTGVPGAWAPGYVVTQTDLQTIDERLAACIHEGGGTWALSAPLIIGNSTVRFTDVFQASGNVTFDGAAATVAVSVNTAFEASGTTTLQGATTYITSAAVNVGTGFNAPNWQIKAGSQFDFLASATLKVHGGFIGYAGSTLDQAGLSTFTGQVHLHGITYHDGVETFGSEATCTWNGAANNAAVITNTSSGRVVRRLVDKPDTNATYALSDGEDFHCTLVGSCTWTFSNTGAQNGDEINVSIEGSGTGLQTLTVNRADGAALGTALRNNAAGDSMGLKLRHNGTHWYVYRRYYRP